MVILYCERIDSTCMHMILHGHFIVQPTATFIFIFRKYHNRLKHTEEDTQKKTRY